MPNNRRNFLKTVGLGSAAGLADPALCRGHAGQRQLPVLRDGLDLRIPVGQAAFPGVQGVRDQALIPNQRTHWLSDIYGGQ